MHKKNNGSYYQIKKAPCDIYNVENNNLLSSKIIDCINIEKNIYKVVEEKFKIKCLQEKRNSCKNIKIVTYDIKYNEIGLVEKEKDELINKDTLKFYGTGSANDINGLELYNIYECRINNNLLTESGQYRIFEENKEFYINNYSFNLTIKRDKEIFQGNLVNNNSSGKMFEKSFFDFYGKVYLGRKSKIIIREEYKTFLKVNNIEVTGINEDGTLLSQVEYFFKVQKEICVLANNMISVFCPIKQ